MKSDTEQMMKLEQLYKVGSEWELKNFDRVVRFGQQMSYNIGLYSTKVLIFETKRS